MEKAACEFVKLERDWNAIIEGQARSQKTAADFCREQGIVYGTFLYHRSKRLKKGSRTLAIARSAAVAPSVRQRGFVPVQVEVRCGVRLRFPRGLVVESDGLPPAAWVAEVAARFLVDEVGPC